jgi:DNA repair protein RecO (recombination protein O)
MAYNIYTTRGLVLSYRPLREADRVYSILTSDLGLIRATATGVRKGVSKLRGSLEPISLVSVSLIRGKEYWRITSAEEIQKIPSTVELLKPLTLLDKLVQGESPNRELFDAVEKMILEKDTHESMFEIKLVSQILFHLGYLNEEDLSLEKKELIKAVNKGIEASHLAN